MLQFIQHVLPRNLHLAFTLHDSILERAQKKLNGDLSEFLLHLYFFGELELFLVVKAALVIIKYYFDERSCFRLTKSSSNISWRISCCCLMKSIIYMVKLVILEKYIGLQKYNWFRITKISNLKKYIDFQK